MADKIVQLVDKNSNNLYPVAGAVIDNAVSTGAISSQAVTNAKIENGAVNGVANDATAIGTAKLALDTVGTPNLRDASVTSDKIDFTTLGTQSQIIPLQNNVNLPANSVMVNIGSPINFNVVSGGQYIILARCVYVVNKSASAISIGLRAVSGANTQESTIRIIGNGNNGVCTYAILETDGSTLSVQRIGTSNANVAATCDVSGLFVTIFRVG